MAGELTCFTALNLSRAQIGDRWCFESVSSRTRRRLGVLFCFLEPLEENKIEILTAPVDASQQVGNMLASPIPGGRAGREN